MASVNRIDIETGATYRVSCRDAGANVYGYARYEDNSTLAASGDIINTDREFDYTSELGITSGQERIDLHYFSTESKKELFLFFERNMRLIETHSDIVEHPGDPRLISVYNMVYDGANHPINTLMLHFDGDNPMELLKSHGVTDVELYVEYGRNSHPTDLYAKYHIQPSFNTSSSGSYMEDGILNPFYRNRTIFSGLFVINKGLAPVVGSNNNSYHDHFTSDRDYKPSDIYTETTRLTDDNGNYNEVVLGEHYQDRYDSTMPEDFFTTVDGLSYTLKVYSGETLLLIMKKSEPKMLRMLAAISGSLSSRKYITRNKYSFNNEQVVIDPVKYLSPSDTDWM